MKIRRFKLGSHILEFYRTDDDVKYRFRIMKNEILTQKILSRVKTKRVKGKSIHYAVRGLRELISEFESDTTIPQIKEDAITILGEKCKKKFGEFPEYSLLGFSDNEENVLVMLPDESSAEGYGSTYEEAAEDAVKNYLKWYNW